MRKKHICIVNSEYDHPGFKQFCEEIEAHITRPEKILKKDKVSYVCVVRFNEQLIVVKRSNIKNQVHAIRQTFRTSRAMRNCKHAVLLKEHDIRTFEPIAAIETKPNLLSGPSYLLTTYLQGKSAVEIYGYNHKPSPEWASYAQAIVLMMQRLAQAGIFHHDLNLSNIIICDGEPALIDLDSLKKTSIPLIKKWYAQRERKRFLENFIEPPAQSASALRLFSKLLAS